MQRSDARKRMSDPTPRQLLTEARQAMMAELKAGIAEYVKANEELHDQIEELHTLVEKAEAERDAAREALARVEALVDEREQRHDDRCESEYETGAHAWTPCGCWASRSEAEGLVHRAEKAEAERDAYHKAKQENDERFMLERDEARAERDAAREALARVEALIDWHETKAEKARLYRPEVDGENRVMDKTAEVHDDAARRLRAALAQPATDEEAGQ